VEQVVKVEDVKEAQFKTVKRLVKGLVSSSLKVSGGDPAVLFRAIRETDHELKEERGITLYEYGLEKVVDSIVQNARIMEKWGIVPTVDYMQTAESAIERFALAVSSIEDSVKLENALFHFERMRNVSAA